MIAVEPRAFFEEQFRNFYDGKRVPYQWQRELFDQFVGGKVPSLIDLPTGTGKTTVMVIWYIALAWMIQSGGKLLLPRRLVWVVNRRVVVDQATDVAKKIQEKSFGRVVISTLRGQLADNGEWKLDPTRLAIVIGTVDMIGSKLLFSGYGDGAYWRPHHAGLLGVDSLFVNDEAHLTPPFAKLISAVEGMKPAAKIPGMQFLFCQLSATQATAKEGAKFPKTLDADLLIGSEFYKRVMAEKRLFLHRETDKKRADAVFFNLASQPTAPRTVIFRENPEAARQLAESLDGIYQGGIALLTGTMRGLERDLLAESDPIFGKFLSKEPPNEPVLLVATSAGEVGVDLTCERMITMLVEADHLTQRFGRLNRFGGVQGEAHVVFTPPNEKDPELAETLKWLLEALPSLGDQKDIRAMSLREHPAPPSAYEKQPNTAEFSEWLIELWSQTTGDVKNYPPVKHWLHGDEVKTQETSLAWRRETDDLIRAKQNGFITAAVLNEILDKFEILPHERLSEPTYRLTEKLKSLAEKRPGTQALVRGVDGSVEVHTLEAMTHQNFDLGSTTVILPEEIGVLNRGMFKDDFEEAGADLLNKDIADQFPKDGDRWHRRGNEDDLETGDVPIVKVPLFDSDDDDAERTYWLYYKTADKKRATVKKEYLLEVHLAEVRDKAASFARALVPDLESVYEWVGKTHDEGKDRTIWQNAMGRCPGKVVAKSYRPGSWQQLAGYRHEVGTLAKLRGDEPPSGQRDLALHLIAAHHGNARPFFRDCSQDAENFTNSQEVIDGTPQRFARLTEEWGVWGLAYLEAIFKSADGFISAQAEGKFPARGDK